MFIIITCGSVWDRLRSPSELVNSWRGECDGRMWSMCIVVYYLVQCVIVHVARRARLVYDVVSTGTYKGWEDLV